MLTDRISFESWRAALRIDCSRNDKLREFHCLGEEVLRTFYEIGTEPTVAGLLRDSEK